MSLLSDAAAKVAAPATAYETVRDSQTDPQDDRVAYAVERRASDGALFLTVTRERQGKDPSVRRIALAPVARALDMGVID